MPIRLLLRAMIRQHGLQDILLGGELSTGMQGNVFELLLNSTTAGQYTPRLIVLDLRSYTATLANRAKGGGSECTGMIITTYCTHITSLHHVLGLEKIFMLLTDYYTNCDVHFKNLPNIHSVRKSLQQLRTLLSTEEPTR